MASPPDAAPWWGRADARPRRPLPQSTDVIVVGAGITGVAMALHLQRRGLDVSVLECAHLGAGASGRNAGFLLVGVAENYSRAVDTFGRDVARQVWELTRRNHRLLHELLHDADAAGYRQAGSWTLADTADEAVQLERSATLLHEDALPGELHTDISEAGQRYPSGLLNTEDGEVHPVRLLEQLAADVDIHQGMAVHAVEADGGSVLVRTGDAEIRAGHCVIATNAYTTALLPETPIAPVRAQMLASAAQTGSIARRPVYAHWGYRYWRQMPGGEVLLGGFRDRNVAAEVGWDDTPGDIVQEHLEGHLRDLGVDAAVTHRWAGTMGFTPDTLPLVGSTAIEGVSICAGYTGHGMGFAVAASELLAAQIVDGTPVPAWLDARRVGQSVGQAPGQPS